jgi:Holliday junction resolvase RusA-like endonuclease
MPAYRFNVVPVAAPRMTHADRWKRRPCVVKYFEYRDQVRAIAAEQGFTLPERFYLWFQMPMPKSWSQRKKRMMFGEPCRVKPDADNLAKGFFDCFGEDKHVWSVQITKTWHDKGGIVVSTPYDEFCLTPHFEYKSGAEYESSDGAKRDQAECEQEEEKRRLLAKVKSRLAQEQYEHEWAWRKHQGHIEGRWQPADERGVWRPDFEDFED